MIYCIIIDMIQHYFHYAKIFKSYNLSVRTLNIIMMQKFLEKSFERLSDGLNKII